MKRLISMVLTTTFMALSYPGLASGGGDDRATGCERAATNMFRSCRSEVIEEYYATNAKCINFADFTTRRECRQAAWATRVEDRLGCWVQRRARRNACRILGEDRYDPEGLLDAANFIEDPDDANPYFSLQPGHTYVARAGEDFEETIVVTVTDEVREILGVNCRIVVDIVLVQEDGEFEAVEVTDDFYALAVNGDVHYCGEVSRNFEDGALNNLDGSFEAGLDLAKSGILIKAMPVAGDAHRQEYLPGEAEDLIRYVAGVFNPTSVDEGDENPNFPCNGNCIKTEEFIPPEPESGEFKYFLPGVGFILGIALEDGEVTGERDEVQCVGDSLDVLDNDPSCGLNSDPEALEQLKEELCKQSPDAFCD